MVDISKKSFAVWVLAFVLPMATILAGFSTRINNTASIQSL